MAAHPVKFDVLVACLLSLAKLNHSFHSVTFSYIITWVVKHLPPTIHVYTRRFRLHWQNDRPEEQPKKKHDIRSVQRSIPTVAEVMMIIAYLRRTASFRRPFGIHLDELKTSFLDGSFIQLTIQVLHPGIQEAIQFINPKGIKRNGLALFDGLSLNNTTYLFFGMLNQYSGRSLFLP